MDCPTHEIHEIKCPLKINDFTVLHLYYNRRKALRLRGVWKEVHAVGPSQQAQANAQQT